MVGYAPLGFLLALSALRTVAAVRSACAAVLLATLRRGRCRWRWRPANLSARCGVASNVDLGLNALAGAWLGALAWRGGLSAWGAMDALEPFSRPLVCRPRIARGALVLLALWPFALLFPASVPFGLGQVVERVEAGWPIWLSDTPFLEWLPVREVELQPLLPLAELLCVMLGAADALSAGLQRAVNRSAVAALAGHLAGTVLATAWRSRALSAALELWAGPLPGLG